MKLKRSVLAVIIAFVLLFVCAIAIMTVAWLKDRPTEGQSEETTKYGFVYGEDVDPKTDIVIDTEYMPLFFPGKFKDQVKHEIIDDSDYYLVSFSGIVGESECRLFDVYFGLDLGFCIGYVKKDDAEIPIYVDIADIEKDPSWTEEEFDRICAMQEAMNYTMQRIQESVLYSDAE